MFNTFLSPDIVAEVERMKGGGYNRIIGVNMVSGKRYILRIPYCAQPVNHELADQVAIIRHVKKNSSIAVPCVIRFDVESRNPIQLPYMIQTRLKGVPLHHLIDLLNFHEKQNLTTVIVELWSKICNLTFRAAGILRAQDLHTAKDVVLTITGDVDPQEPHPRNAMHFLVSCFQGQMKEARRRNHHLKYELMRRLHRATIALSGVKPIINKFSLYHWDLAPRNILVVRNTDGSFAVTGLLDLDGATAAPIEVAWVLPYWLWSCNGSTRSSESVGEEQMDEIPKDDESRAIKNLFEREIEKAVPSFMSVWRRGKHARQLFYYAVNGIRDSRDTERIEQLTGEIITTYRTM